MSPKSDLRRKDLRKVFRHTRQRHPKVQRWVARTARLDEKGNVVGYRYYNGTTMLMFWKADNPKHARKFVERSDAFKVAKRYGGEVVTYEEACNSYEEGG